MCTYGKHKVKKCTAKVETVMCVEQKQKDDRLENGVAISLSLEVCKATSECDVQEPVSKGRKRNKINKINKEKKSKGKKHRDR